MQASSAPRQMLRTAKTAGISYLQAARHRRQFNEVRRFCAFLGYPCSGHSIIASLLNAHPDVVIANELDCLRFVEAGYTRDRLFGLLLYRDAEFEANGRILHTMPPYYDLSVPGQAQGIVRSLQVIGDKQGHQMAVRAHEDPALLSRLRQTAGVPLRVIHVLRNPYDNIATLTTRRNYALQQGIDDYASLCEAVSDVRGQLEDGELFELRSEDFTADPASALADLCAFLDVAADDGYLKGCAKVVRQSVSRTREKFEWNDHQRQQVDGLITRYTVLRDYSFAE